MNEISVAKQQWDNFLESVTADQRKELSAYEDRAKSIDLISYARTKDYIKFDQVFNTLSKRYKFEEEVIPEVYRCYLDRNLLELAFSYLNAAFEYCEQTGRKVSAEMEELKLYAVDDKLIEKVRSIIGELRNLRPQDIPKVMPAVVNEKKRLGEYILEEIVRGLRIMRKKIKAVHSIINEDNFNDVLLATMRLRQQIWGWEIADQERSGPSTSGKGTGEVDITLKAGGNDIAVIEALKMKGKDFANLEKHILKCVEYVRDMEYYYIVVYYYGSRDQFADFCKTYDEDVMKINYKPNWVCDTNEGFQDINSIFTNTENIFIGKTIHGAKKYELFHILADMSS